MFLTVVLFCSKVVAHDEFPCYDLIPFTFWPWDPFEELRLVARIRTKKISRHFAVLVTIYVNFTVLTIIIFSQVISFIWRLSPSLLSLSTV